MSALPSPKLPKSRIPAWERRRGPDRWQWNGRRRGDPHLPFQAPAEKGAPLRLLFFALAGSLAGLSLLILAFK